MGSGQWFRVLGHLPLQGFRISGELPHVLHVDAHVRHALARIHQHLPTRLSTPLLLKWIPLLLKWIPLLLKLTEVPLLL